MNLKAESPRLYDLRAKPHLSASGVMDYIECGLRYKFSRVDKKTPDFRSPNLVLGSAIHRTLKQYNIARRNGKMLTLEDLQDRFDVNWKDIAKGFVMIRYPKGTNGIMTFNEGVKLIETFYENLPEKPYTVLEVEEPFQFYIHGIEAPVIGAMDLIEADESGTAIIADYKTSAKAYSKDQIDRNFQMTVYHMAARANGYADRELLLRLDCLIKTKTPKFEQYYTTRSEDDATRAEMVFRAVWDGINKNVFVPNPTSWKCKNCEYKSHCNKWHEKGTLL
jgi:putative RecB family exonuclease